MVIDKNHYWTTIKYTKPLQFGIMSALRDNNRNIAIFMKGKKALVSKLAFLKLPISFILTPNTAFGLTYNKVTKEIVSQV